MTTKKPRTQVYTVTTTETTARVMKIRARTPEEAMERADDTPDDYTHTEPGETTVEDEDGRDVTPEDDEPEAATPDQPEARDDDPYSHHVTATWHKPDLPPITWREQPKPIGERDPWARCRGVLDLAGHALELELIAVAYDGDLQECEERDDACYWAELGEIQQAPSSLIRWRGRKYAVLIFSGCM